MFANAATVGGWNLSNAVAQGASTVYDATKNVVINGKDFVKDSWVKITPNATQVAKVLRGGVAGAALSVAVEQLLGAVEWVLDPENNRVKYKEIICVSDCSPDGYKYYWGGVAYSTYHYPAEQVCKSAISTGGFTGVTRLEMGSIFQVECFYNSSKQYAGGTFWMGVDLAKAKPQTEEQERYLPLETVAAQVISNAESDTDKRPAAQVATSAAAADIVAEAEKDDAKARPIANQAEANAQTKPADEAEAEKANEAQGQSKPNEANPDTMDISLEFPVFCSWAPTVCEAAQVVISFPQTLTGWWESANQKADDWATSISQAYHDFMRDDELPNDDTKVDITDIPTPELQENAISWGAACPADVSIPISMQGVSSTLVFSWSPWCQLLSIIKPAIIASAYIGAAFIVLGLRT